MSWIEKEKKEVREDVRIVFVEHLVILEFIPISVIKRTFFQNLIRDQENQKEKCRQLFPTRPNHRALPPWSGLHHLNTPD